MLADVKLPPRMQSPVHGAKHQVDFMITYGIQDGKVTAEIPNPPVLSDDIRKEATNYFMPRAKQLCEEMKAQNFLMYAAAGHEVGENGHNHAQIAVRVLSGLQVISKLIVNLLMNDHLVLNVISDITVSYMAGHLFSR